MSYTRYPIFHSTVTAGDLLYTPSAFAVVEAVGRENDVVGFVLRGFVPGDPRSHPILSSLQSRASPAKSAVVKVVLDELSKAPATRDKSKCAHGLVGAIAKEGGAPGTPQPVAESEAKAASDSAPVVAADAADSAAARSESMPAGQERQAGELDLAEMSPRSSDQVS